MVCGLLLPTMRRSKDAFCAHAPPPQLQGGDARRAFADAIKIQVRNGAAINSA
jgi:hypothetical protein